MSDIIALTVQQIERHAIGVEFHAECFGQHTHRRRQRTGADIGVVHELVQQLLMPFQLRSGVAHQRFGLPAAFALQNQTREVAKRGPESDFGV